MLVTLTYTQASTHRRQPVQSLDGWEKNIHTYIDTSTGCLGENVTKSSQQPFNKEELAGTIKFAIHRMLGG